MPGTMAFWRSDHHLVNGLVSQINPKNDPHTNKKEGLKPLYKFYKNGQCKRAKECRFDHPAIRKKFRQFGPKTSNDKGCENIILP